MQMNLRSSFGLSLLLFLSSAVLSGEGVKVTAQVLDRDDDGAAIQGKYVYPEVELESGESAALHVGRDFRYQVWDQGLNDFSGIGEIYENTKIGLKLALKVSEAGGVIAYSGSAETVLVNGVADHGSSVSSTRSTFFGRVNSGEFVEVAIVDAAGQREVIALHFAKIE